ncbi:TetR family transcriptional regulator C-terminal domain-containing protein [Streptomyces prunicolor]|uniref:TetR family transcriptional regulator C-terminal domain-containing protein n=1 Tax=Streptomyces prunicolor TaxID=67348 RepID=UPI0003A9B5B7|nr:TetR family transcriptional regulator C-terminal domain-containing protein [Streptomyces prunicolor]
MFVGGERFEYVDGCHVELAADRVEARHTEPGPCAEAGDLGTELTALRDDRQPACKEATLHAALEYYAQRFRTRLDEEFGRATSARDKLRRLIEVQLPLTADDIDEWSVWIQFWNQAMLEPRLRPAQRRIYSGWYRVVVDVLDECRSEGLAPEADVEALADRFTAMVDGLAMQILAGSTEMRPDRMRSLLLRAFEPHLDLTDHPGTPG